MKRILNFRVDQEVKDEIDLIAEQDEVTPSESARNLLYQALQYDEVTKTRPETVIDPVFELKNIEIKMNLFKSVIWLFVNLYSNSFVTHENLLTTKGTLEKLFNEDRLSNKLRFELTKVSNDIDRVLSLGIENTSLNFNKPNNVYSLNYNILFSEVCNFINQDYRYEYI